MTDQKEILLEFYLNPERIALTHDPKWDPHALLSHALGAHRSRSEKLQTVDLEWDDTLWMPARLRIRDYELFVCPGWAHPRIEAIDGPGPAWFPDVHDPCPWKWVPVVTLAVGGLFLLQLTRDQKVQSMTLGETGDLVFLSHGTGVEIQLWDVYAPNLPGHSSRTPRQATIEYKDLVAAWEAFSEEVRTQFLEVLPELAEHKELGPWFREGLAYLKRQPL